MTGHQPRTASAREILTAWQDALMPDVLTVTVGLPARTLSANARVHWAVRMKATKRARVESWAATQVAMHEAGEKGGWKEATCQVHWYARDARRRDKDNCLSSLKATFDGMVDAGLLEDDSALTHLPLVILVDAKNPRVELLLKRWEAKHGP
jgi:Holliday junction resolvase RusA-like endonuclease